MVTTIKENAQLTTNQVGFFNKNGFVHIKQFVDRQHPLLALFRKRQFIDHRSDPREVGFDIEAGNLTIHNGSLWRRVEQSPYEGAASRRRVMYIPIITGAYQPKNQPSKTPFYHRLAQRIQD